MKILYIFILLLLFPTIKAQESTDLYKPLSSFNNDTLKYLEYNFVENKDLYIGKELNTITNKLEIKINSCYPFNDSISSTVISGIALTTLTGNDFIPKTNIPDSLNHIKLSVTKTTYVIELTFQKGIKNKSRTRYKKYTAISSEEWGKLKTKTCGKIIIKDIRIFLLKK